MRFLYLGALAPAMVAALAPALPDQTYAAKFEDPGVWGASPAPTKAPNADHWILELFKRQDDPDRTCGYQDGNLNSMVTCATGRVCATNSIWDAAGCCDPLNMAACMLKTSCFPSAAMSSCTGACLTNSHIARCTGVGSSFCYVRKWDFVSTTMTELGCGAIRATYTMALSYSGQSLGSSRLSVASAPTQTVTVTGSSTDAGAAGFFGSSATGSSATGNTATGTRGLSYNTAGATATPVAKKSNIGPIAGGVIAGLAALALIAGAIGFFCIKKKKNAKNAIAASTSQQPQPLYTSAPPSTMQQAPIGEYKPPTDPSFMQPQQYPPPQQNYDPNNPTAYYAAQTNMAGPLPPKQDYMNVNAQSISEASSPGVSTMGGISPYSPPGSPPPPFPNSPQMYQGAGQGLPVGIAEAGGLPVQRQVGPPTGVAEMGGAPVARSGPQPGQQIHEMQ